MLADQPLDVPLVRIGELVRQPGLWQASLSGERQELRRSGFEHRFMP
jgi:hypothetical protein